MSFVSIPLQNTANQDLDTILDNVPVTINLKTTDYGLFIDVTYNGTQVVAGGLCRDRVDINRAKWLGMPSPLWFADLQGTTDPQFAGFNTRYLLCYGTPTNVQETIA